MPRDKMETDWKLLRRVRALALERFCERGLAELERVTRNAALSAHQRYLNVFEIVEQRDRDIARLFDDPRRSQGLAILARLPSEGLLTETDFSSLSPDARCAITTMLGSG